MRGGLQRLIEVQTSQCTRSHNFLSVCLDTPCLLLSSSRSMLYVLVNMRTAEDSPIQLSMQLIKTHNGNVSVPRPIFGSISLSSAFMVLKRLADYISVFKPKTMLHQVTQEIKEENNWKESLK